MSKSKIVGMMVLIAFAMSIVLVNCAVAAEKFKWRVVWYNVKFQSLNVPGEEGRIMAFYENKGILTVLEGSKLMDGMAAVDVGSYDLNTKTGTGLGHGEIHFTNRDGDKIYWGWECKVANNFWSGPITIVRGTGKFQGVKGKATYSSVDVAPGQNYVDWDGEVELPR